MQFAEGLTDRQAADAVRTRIDCKYALCPELTDAGFHSSVLCEFRARLLTDGAERLPAALRCCLPHDPEVRVGSKRETTWLGYKLHLTEGCQPDLPLLLTDVQTTLATTTDYEMTGKVQAALGERDLLPATHVVDAGYVTADEWVSSRTEHHVELLGSVLTDNHWQARTTSAFSTEDCHIEWEQRRVCCPQGHTSVAWCETHDPYARG